MTADTDIAVEGDELTEKDPTDYTLTYSFTNNQGATVTVTTTVSIEII